MVGASPVRCEFIRTRSWSFQKTRVPKPELGNQKIIPKPELGNQKMMI